MVIGRSFKESSFGYIFLFLFLIISLSVFTSISILYIPILSIKILVSSILGILILMTFYIPYFVYKQRKQEDDVLIYDEYKEEFIIHYHNRIVNIQKKDIIRITNHNLGLDMTSIMARQNNGKIKFYLKNGDTYKTPYIDNIYDVYFKIDEILSLEFNEEEPKLARFGKWGAKKEYPSILSLLIAIVLPLIGFVFVENQAKYKEIKNGKNNGLTITALTISSLWWIVVFILIFVVF